MITDVIIGWMFGGLAVILHFTLLVLDWHYNIPFRFYHISQLLWIIGNYLWMCVEFMLNKESSDIHFGPHTPIGGISVHQGAQLTAAKSYFFLAAILVQFYYYILIRWGVVVMPRDETQAPRIDESYHSHSSSSTSSSTEDLNLLAIGDFQEVETQEIFNPHRYPFGFTLTFIEHLYIVLWISKDYFWSWASGDFHVQYWIGYTAGRSARICLVSV